MSLQRTFHQASGDFPSQRDHLPLAGTKLHCLVTEAHSCK